MKRWKNRLKDMKDQAKLILEIFHTSHKFDSKITWCEILHGLCENGIKVINVIIPGTLVNMLLSGTDYRVILCVVLGYGAGVSLLGLGEKSFKLLQESHGFRACNLFRLSMNQKFMRLDYADTENSKISDLFEQARESMWEFVDVGYVIFNDILGNLVTFLSLSYIIASVSLPVYLAVMGLIFAGTFLEKRKIVIIHDSDLKEKAVRRRMDYEAKTMRDFSAGQEIRIYSLAAYLEGKFAGTSQAYQKVTDEREGKLLTLGLCQNGLGLLQIVLIYFAAVKRYRLGRLSLGSFLLYISAVRELAVSIRNLSDAIVELAGVSEYYKDYLAFMQFPEQMRETGNLGVSLINKKPLAGEQEFRWELHNVGYRYPGSERYAVKGVNISFGSGRKIALVGENGSGKSTLIKLLLRLYDPTEGQILLNGIDIRDYDFNQYLALFSTVFQDFSIFSYPVKENIVFDRELESGVLEQALRTVGLEQRLCELPLGEATPVGKTLDENGVDFSGGEKQSIAIARAFCHNAPVGVFDEPTAALDPIREAQIYNMIREFYEDRTIIYCSHRMSSTRFCDSILVLEDGILKEYGNHQELMKIRGIYYDMYEKQASLYL